MPKEYFFQAGSFTDISHAELIAVFEAFNLNKDTIHTFYEDIFLIKSNDISEDVLLNIFNRLGGFVRMGYILNDLDSFLNEYIHTGKKVVFGLNILGRKERDDFKYLKRLGNEIKRGLKEYGIPSRFVFPKEKDMTLNAAQVLNNGILRKGFELSIIRGEEEQIYGKTLAIQDMEGFVRRDIVKPYADVKMGMLPPKLARIMVNLLGIKDGTVWDPFCGSGTIPMECAVLGYDFLASDVDEYAVKGTDENIKWLNSECLLGNIVYETFVLDINSPDSRILKKLKNTNISAIVCEPFMGPPQKKLLSEEKAKDLINDVKSLYSSLFNMLDEKIGVRGIKMVLILPSYKCKNGWLNVGIRDIVSNRWEVLNSRYSPKRDLKWSRKNSIITRNIFILRRT